MFVMKILWTIYAIKTLTLHACNDNLVDYICNKNIDATCL